MNLNKISEKEKTFKTNIGQKIQGLIELHHLSLSKMAAATGLTAETIRQIVNGTIKNPGIETLAKIADAFSMSLFQLLGASDVTSHINKQKIKIVDIFDLEKMKSGQIINDLIDQSVESIEIIYMDNNLIGSDFFAIEVSNTLADKLTNCGMPMLKQGDLLIFTKNVEYSANSIILAQSSENILIIGICIEIEGKYVWVKSVDIPQKQIVIKIPKENIIGFVHNVQFSK